MAEMTSEGAGSSAGAGIDLSQFYQVFFEEAGENLQNMEQQLLELDVSAADDEALNAIFRCAHSIKGGAATFGFADVAELTHEMETLLDKLRRHELAPHASMVDVLLAAGDALREQLGRHQGSGADPVDTRELLARVRALASGEVAAAAAAPAPVVVTAVQPSAPAPVEAEPMAPTTADGKRVLDLRIGPLTQPEQADNLLDLFKEITDLGTIEPLDMGQAIDGMRRFKVETRSSDADLIDLFGFHVAREQVQILPATASTRAIPALRQTRRRPPCPPWRLLHPRPIPATDSSTTHLVLLRRTRPSKPRRLCRRQCSPRRTTPVVWRRPPPPPRGQPPAARRPTAAAWTPPPSASRWRRWTS